MRGRAWRFSVLAVVAFLVTGLGGVAAQDGAFADLTGIPEIPVTLTDAGVEGVPAETPAGWTLVTFTNNVTPTGDPFSDSWALEILLLPEDKTIDDLTAALAALTGGEGGPPAEADESANAASPAAALEDPFAWANTAYQPGGPGALPGETTQGLVNLTAGSYGILVVGPFPVVPLTVVEAAEPAVEPDIAADITITENGTSGSFDFVGEAGAFAGGPAVIQIVNDSDQPHFIFGLHSPNPITEEQAMAILMSDGGGTPPADGPDPSTILPAFITGTQAPDTTQYVAADLQPGYYVLLCFVGDPNMGGVPHSIAGMIEVVPVGV